MKPDETTSSLPPAFCKRMKELLQGEYEDFIHALSADTPTSIRLNPGKADGYDPSAEPVPWCGNGFYLDKRPTFTLDPLFHAGSYYVQEASSMFLEHVLKQIMPDKPLRVLDLCAAPGGKSTLAASLLPSDSLLVANEVIQSRASILKENIIRWGHDNIVVTNSDPAYFRNLKGLFDIVLVDAPCSGEGMFRKDKRAIEEWSESNLALCANRQKRILTDIWESLKPEGFLIYSTCTFNPGENEEIAMWMTEQFSCSNIEITHPYSGIVSSDSKPFSYRFYPHKVKGEGFFITVIQKKEGEEYMEKREKNKKTSPLSVKEIEKFIVPETEIEVYIADNLYGIVPALHAHFVKELEKHLKVIYKGCEVLELLKGKNKLLHPLALYRYLNRESCSVHELEYAQAIRYLRKEDTALAGKNGEWLLMTYHNIGIGWSKNVGNRLNNYFPKEWRIRMQINE